MPTSRGPHRRARQRRRRVLRRRRLVGRRRDRLPRARRQGARRDRRLARRRRRASSTARKRVAEHIGIAHEIVSTDELARAGYRANGADRCYFCKSELYDVLAELASQRGYNALLSGANQDDQGDWRPGLKAAAEHDVVHPLQRRHEGRGPRARPRTSTSPAPRSRPRPCLASRIPYGTAVDPETLALIDRAERNVQGARLPRSCGSATTASWAASRSTPTTSTAPSRTSTQIVAAIKAAGYRHAVIDREPFRSGRLNAALVRPAASR